ncbi:MAG: hypothetical protein KKD44_10775 [Proteobacteria bacterium]|nr:hypothetical protein [Pseudomonadota bacterium]
MPLSTDPDVTHDVAWVPDHDGACLIISKHRSLRLTMEDAIVWDILHRFPYHEKQIELVAAVFQIDSDKGLEMINRCIMQWNEEMKTAPPQTSCPSW